MFLKHSQIAPARISGLLDAAETAVRAIPPAFPLDATVAVNPFMGQAGEPLESASARLKRVSGARLTPDRAHFAAAIEQGRITDDDLAEALFACRSPLKPTDLALLKAKALVNHEKAAITSLPTVADLATEATGTDWPSIIDKSIGLWAAGHFDRGQALWSPTPGRSAFAAWRAWATHDLTPEIAGLSGFCSHVAEAPDTPERGILRAAQHLGLTEAAAETAFHRLLIDLAGWAQHARWLLWQAEMKGETDRTLADLLAIRLIWEEALFKHVPAISARWMETVAAHEAPIAPTQDDVIDAILQDAAERAYQRRLNAALCGPNRERPQPVLQAAFCIDVRSEVFRRALESVSPQIDTIGFAGFFGLPIAHTDHGSDVTENHLPALLSPTLETTCHLDHDSEQKARIKARTKRAWGRFRQAAVSSFAFVEAAGPAYAVKLMRDSLNIGTKPAPRAPAPRILGTMSPATRAEIAARVLRAMSLTDGFGKVVLLLGHGAQTTNNPHQSAYHCGACGGHTGEVSARVLADLLNDAETRAVLPALGVTVPEGTTFLAGLHDTTTDVVTLYETATANVERELLETVRSWLDRAGAMARAERALRFPGSGRDSASARARNWAEVRPEWGLAGCSAFIAAPRSATSGIDLDGRTFLHSYDWRTDKDFETLELVLTAPVVVASWISLQYYGSTVAPDVFGGGNKLIHNVIGGIGVVQGNGGRLRTGLPWQAVHDGLAPVHEPLRLSVLIEAPRDAITAVLKRHPDVQSLFDNGWMHLFTLRDGQIDARYRPGLAWLETPRRSLAA